MMPFVNLTAQRTAYKDEFEQAEKAVLDSGCYIGGPFVAELEEKLADFCGAKHAVTCGSGTEALTIALMTLGVHIGDEVIVPDFTFVAPAECVAGLGAKPVFADINPETLQIDVASVKASITPHTRGIIAVDLFGQCAPFAELREVARKNGLWLLEDAAQAFGATVATSTAENNGQAIRRAGTFGDISITSFYPSKPLGCYGDGGALFTSDDELASKIKQIANHGSREHYLHEIVGVNSRLDALQAAVLLVKLRHFEAELAVRRKNARRYDEFFSECNGLRPQKLAAGNSSTYAQYTVLADDRTAFMQKLDQAGIPHCIHYPMPLHRQPCFNINDNLNSSENSGIRSDLNSKAAIDTNNADVASKKAISLPVCAFTDVYSIINKLRNVL